MLCVWRGVFVDDSPFIHECEDILSERRGARIQLNFIRTIKICLFRFSIMKNEENEDMLTTYIGYESYKLHISHNVIARNHVASACKEMLK